MTWIKPAALELWWDEASEDLAKWGTSEREKRLFVSTVDVTHMD
jgi:hypothetical protein